MPESERPDNRLEIASVDPARDVNRFHTLAVEALEVFEAWFEGEGRPVLSIIANPDASQAFESSQHLAGEERPVYSANANQRLWKDPVIRERIHANFAEAIKAVIRTARDSGQEPSFIGTKTLALGVIEDLSDQIDGGIVPEPSTPAELLQRLVGDAWKRVAPESRDVDTFFQSGTPEKREAEVLDLMFMVADEVASVLNEEEEQILIYSILEYREEDGVARVSERMKTLGHQAVRETIQALGTQMQAAGL